MSDDTYHEGRPILRESPDGRTVVVLCPVGHLYHTLPIKEWAGSWLEAKAGDPTWIVRCYGTMPEAPPSA